MTDAIQKAREALASIPHGAIDALANNQRQLDMDGCEVGVSRQAVDEVLAGLRAALAALDAETEGSASINAIAVKPLEWVVPKSGYGQEAYSILGKYWVLHGQFWSPGCTVSKPCRDDAAAKDFAQADFERRIRSALVPPESRS